MSWKIYSLGQVERLSRHTELVISKLGELGYTATFEAGSSDAWGTLSVSIDGTIYSGRFADNSASTKAIAYLCVNAETNEIAVFKNYAITGNLAPSSYLSKTVNFALLRGINAITGETGIFALPYAAYASDKLTNAWHPDIEGDTIILHRAAFKKSSYNEIPFVSSLYWGSMKSTPGAIVSAGGETFVCLNHALYAKV